MAFDDRDRQLLLAVKGVGPTVLQRLEQMGIDDLATLEVRSRLVVERAALALQASALLQAGHGAIAQAFCEARLGPEHGLAYGTLSPRAPFQALIDRALPVI